MKNSRFLFLNVFLPAAAILAQPGDIRMNQVGFYPNLPKAAVVVDAGGLPFFLIDNATQDTVFTGTLSPTQLWSYSDENVGSADFSELSSEGTFVFSVPGAGSSAALNIKPRVHQSMAVAALKSFYYQRTSLALVSEFAGTWSRPAGHPDTNVLIHPSAATAQRPANTAISAPMGWYDAGDYNKYIVNSGITTYTLLATYEHFERYCDELRTAIPESGNSLPDILDEALWNLRWMFTMQDPHDGGVYTKLTNENFDGWIMPGGAVQPRYVVMKSTGAALDFCAVAAQAARVFRAFPTDLPGLADSCLQAAYDAWRWARANPQIYYNQTQMNQQYSPDISTGEYGDGYFGDEFDWAAAELFVTTLEDSFLTVANPLNTATAAVPSWPNVRTLGLYTMAHHRPLIGSLVDTTAVKNRIIGLANSLRSAKNASAYGVVMGAQAGDFVWGSNGVAANQGMALLCAYELTNDSSYLHSALSNLDYILGRNATTYCFVTGFGSKQVMHPHHRPSQSDGISAPVPGLLAGGPNPNQEDGVGTYPSSLSGRSYTDDFESYASNENAINWNAPLVFLAIGLEAIASPDGLPTAASSPSSPDVPRQYGLMQNYPNPFNPVTTIEFSIPKETHATLKIYNLLGQNVRVLHEGSMSRGYHRISVDTSDLPSGVYVYTLATQDAALSKKMVLTK